MHHLYFASCTENGGIYHFVLQNGELQFREKTTCDRPMYLAVTDTKMQAVLRQPFADIPESGIVSWRIREDGSLGTESEQISTQGTVGCHLCCFHGRTYVANYISGSTFCSDGTLRKHTGIGVHPIRQEAPHIHFVTAAPDDKCLLAVDLGMDAIYSYDEKMNILSEAYVPPGNGPRHLAFSEDGKTIFCVNELGCSVSVFRYSNTRLNLIETVSVLADDHKDSTSAAIRVQGNYVYVSNRGDDSISCLEWNGNHLELCSVTPCEGVSPRDFLLVEDLLFCTNEISGNVTIFSVDGMKLMKKGEVDIPAVLCAVKWKK